MNETLRLPFHLGIDRHNRVAQQNGPFYESLRNLVLDDQNDLVRRKAMNYREVLVGTATGGDTSLIAANPPSGLPASVSAPVMPLCLWLPEFPLSNALGVRPTVTAYRCANQTLMLMVDDVTRSVGLPRNSRRPQAVEWQGALWVVAGDGIAVPNNDNAQATLSGLVRIGQYLDGAGRPVASILSGAPFFLGAAVSGHAAALTAFQRPKCINTYRGRVVIGNFPDDQYNQPRRGKMLISDGPGSGPAAGNFDSVALGVTGRDVPNFQSLVDGAEVDPLTSRDLVVGNPAEDIIGFKEISLQQSGAMNQSALLILKEKSVWLATGEPLESSDLGDPRGDFSIIKQPISDGCASNETVCETPWGVIWAGHEDVWFMPNGGGAPTPIGRFISKEFRHTPQELRYLWHASFHEGYYRLAIMSPGQNVSDPVAMENQFWLDLRYGPPQDWTQARWFGPQMYQPIISPNCAETDIQRGTYCMAVEKRAGFTIELFSVQLGWYTIKDSTGGKYAFILAGLDGDDVRDWTCEFSPNEWVVKGSTLDTTGASMSLRRATIGGAPGQAAASDTIWAHGRIKVPFSELTMGAGAGDEPDWTDDTSNTTDGSATWADGGKIAVPSTDQNLSAHEGSDGVAGTRGNAILAFLKTLELDGGRKDLFKQLRTIMLVGSAYESMRWDIRGRSHALEQSDTQREVEAFGGMPLGATALDAAAQSDIGMNDADTAFLMTLDTASKFTVGRTVSFELSELPGFVIRAADLSFSFFVDRTGSNSYGGNIVGTLTEQFYADWGALLTAVCTAMQAACVAESVDPLGTFTPNETVAVGASKARLPRITNTGGSARNWYPLVASGDAVLHALGSMWRQMGFADYSGNYTIRTAPYSPFARKIGKLRLSSLEATARLFKRGPT